MVMNHYVILFCSWSAFIRAKIRHHDIITGSVQIKRKYYRCNLLLTLY